ncbi:UBX11 protein, partial [Polypterus senegalus]|nr:UBX domain-containing protein 11 isoform X1 [Polypterus senegalus]MBN3291294.1 UBX11 protein [Polypterus senegalus]
MSSALSSLGKNKRAPLPDLPDHRRRPVPFKQKLYTDDEAILLNDILKSPFAPAADGTSTSIPKNALLKIPNKGSVPTDLELMSSMMQKLTQLEQKVISQANELKQKDKKISVLEDKIKILQKSKDACSKESSQNEELERTCLELQSQVWEMERFLNDYGMIWVGDKNHQSTEDHKENVKPQQDILGKQYLWQQDNSLVKNFHMNYDLVMENVKDLNVLAGEEEAQIEHVTGGARLTRPKPIPLTLYKNGILMFNGPFRSYEDSSTQQCMQDLMDGYFPSELQRRFPDGVPIKMNDQRDVEFQQNNRWIEFPGIGHTIGNKTDPVLKESAIPGPKLSMEQFLKKLPKTVIKEGKVIDIRGSVQQNLQGTSKEQKDSVILIETPCLISLKERLEIDESSRVPSAKDISTLRIKSEDGEKTFIVKMYFSETIGHLRTYLNQHRGEESCYDIISSFPQRVYSDGSKTLQESGLVPNASLLLRPTKC